MSRGNKKDSITSVLAKSILEITKPFECMKKFHMAYNEKHHMEQLHNMTELIRIRDRNITWNKAFKYKTHIGVITYLDYPPLNINTTRINR